MKTAVYLHAHKQLAVLRGHPWVFPQAIAKVEGKLNTGALVCVYTAEKHLIGFAVYNEHSLYRLRMLMYKTEQAAFDTISLEDILEQRFREAAMVRQALGLPNASTTAFRFFNSEGDGLSGLTIDYYAEVVVVSSSAYWVEQHRVLIKKVLADFFPQSKLLWFSQKKALQQDGFKVQEGLEIQEEMSFESATTVLEEGIRYEVSFSSAQKTGLFLDQRENHRRIAALAKGKKVLDLYSYTGGFALHAAMAGAKQVRAVDSSAAAIKQAMRNAELNGLPNIEFVEADAREFLKEPLEEDLIILDPPKLVPSKKHLEKAKNYYRFLHQSIFKNMKKGSLLLTCNCSSALSAEAFARLVEEQAYKVGRQSRLLGIYGPASCHTRSAHFQEGAYLTALLLVIL